MSNALQVIAGNTGASVEQITDVLKGMIMSAKNQHGSVATDAELAIVSSVCAKYDLNPLVKECAAFVSGGKLQMVVMIDGWYRIVNRQPEFDGVELFDSFDDKGNLVSTTCKMHLKNRSHPVVVTEYLSECKDEKSTVWKKWPARMLRHKAYIQAARMAFGISEMVDDDEASRITGNQQPIKDVTPQAPAVDLKAINDRMAQFASLDDLDAECKAIANELRASGQFDSVRGDLSLMRREHTERINALDVIDVDFGEVIDGEQA